MKIMVFNTQHCQSYITQKIDFELIADVIKNSGADVVGLNEIRGKGLSPDYEDQTAILSSLSGMEHSFFAPAIFVRGTEPYGNSLLSKYSIVQSEIIAVPDPITKNMGKHYETRCLLKAKLSCGLTVLVIHFGLNPDEQENAVKTVIENLESEKCLLMGDFNVTPDNKVLSPIRERMRDAAELFASPLLSFPSDFPTEKIDYIFATPDIEIISADIPPIVASDHRPHTAEIRYE